MREGILTHNGLVVLDRERGHGRDEPGGAHDHGRVDAGPVGHDIVAGSDRHHDLFQRRVACAFAEAVDRAFDLACACLHTGEAVGDGQPQIVMAVGREHDPVSAGDAFAQHGDDVVEFIGDCVAHRVGDVDRRCPGLDGGFHAAAEEIGLGARRVHRRPFHIVGMAARAGDGSDDGFVNLLRAHLQLILPMQRRGADEGMNAPPFRVLQRLAGPVDILRIRACQAADHRVLHELRDLGDGIEIAVRGSRKSGLDDVDAHLVEHLRDVELFLMRHCCAGRLLAIAQRRVENQDTVFFRAFGGGRAGGLRRRNFGHRLRILA